VSFNIIRVWLENAYSRPFLGGVWGTFPLNDATHRPNHKKDRPWAEIRHIGCAVRAGVCVRKKDMTGKKSQKGYISPICREAPTEAIYMKICLLGDVLDVITCAKFQNEIFRGYDFTEGRIFHFLIDL